jgi:hypothetical protein
VLRGESIRGIVADGRYDDAWELGLALLPFVLDSEPLLGDLEVSLGVHSRTLADRGA